MFLDSFINFFMKMHQDFLIVFHLYKKIFFYIKTFVSKG